MFQTICEYSQILNGKLNEQNLFFDRYTLSPTSASRGVCTLYNVLPTYPLFTPDILIQNNATFAGLVKDDLFYTGREPLNAWDVLIAGSVSATAYVDSNNTLLR